MTNLMLASVYRPVMGVDCRTRNPINDLCYAGYLVTARTRSFRH